jgi:Mrp family chromosome partitioning ATPase
MDARELGQEFREKLQALRGQVNRPYLDQLERLMNASKGAGTTTALIDQAKRKNLTLVVHTEDWAEKLRSSFGVKAQAFSVPVTGQTVLIDNGVNWVLLREAQALRKMIEDVLNHIEVKPRKDLVGEPKP